MTICCRVPPESSLSTLRDHVEEQLGSDVIPEDFVFLRSVGRCMAIVSTNTQRMSSCSSEESNSLTGRNHFHSTENQ